MTAIGDRVVVSCKFNRYDGTVIPAFARGTIIRGPHPPGRFWHIEFAPGVLLFCSEDSFNAAGPLDLLADALD